MNIMRRLGRQARPRGGSEYAGVTDIVPGSDVHTDSCVSVNKAQLRTTLSPRYIILTAVKRARNNKSYEQPRSLTPHPQPN